MGNLITIKAHGAKGQSLGGLLGHCERNSKQQAMIQAGKSKAQYDPALSSLNFDLADNGKSAVARLAYIQKDLYINPDPRTNIAASWIWTMPEEYAKTLDQLPPEEARKKTEFFFKEIKNFLDNRYCGSQSVLAASVHLDEFSPHMHYVFVPRVDNPKHDKKPGEPRYKVASNKLLTKKDLFSIHQDLERYLCTALGVKYVGIAKPGSEEQKKTSRMSHAAFMQSKREAEEKKREMYANEKSDLEQRIEKRKKTLLGELGTIEVAEQEAKNILQNLNTIFARAKDGDYITKKGFVLDQTAPGKVLLEDDYKYLLAQTRKTADAQAARNLIAAKLRDEEQRTKDAESAAKKAERKMAVLVRACEALAQRDPLARPALSGLLRLAADPSASAAALADEMGKVARALGLAANSAAGKTRNRGTWQR